MSDKDTLKRVMELRDKISPSPEQRATHLWEAIHKLPRRPTFWDLVCFCAETFAIVAAEYTFLKPIAARLVSVVYTAHYQTPDPYPSCLDDSQAKPEAVLESGIATVLGSKGLG